VLRDINRLAREERRPARLDTCRVREIEKQLERCFGEPVFRIVEQDVVKLNVERANLFGSSRKKSAIVCRPWIAVRVQSG